MDIVAQALFLMLSKNMWAYHPEVLDKNMDLQGFTLICVLEQIAICHVLIRTIYDKDVAKVGIQCRKSREIFFRTKLVCLDGFCSG